MNRRYVAAIVGAAVTIAIGIYQYTRVGSIAPIQLQFNVFAPDRSPASDAAITLKIGSSVASERANKDGTTTFLVAPSNIGKSSDVEITLGSRASLRTKLIIPTKNSSADFVLEEQAPPPVLPTSSASAVPQADEFLEKTYRSGPSLSGARTDFSDWYELCTDTPPGYTIVQTSIQLTGDRKCGAWAVCEEIRKGPNACMRFRLQGHNEWAGSGQSLSEGILTVKYRKVQ